MTGPAVAPGGGTDVGTAVQQARDIDDSAFASAFGLEDLVSGSAPASPPAAEGGEEALPGNSGRGAGAPAGESSAPDGQEPESTAPKVELQEGTYTQDATGAWHRPDGQFASAEEVAALESDETAAELAASHGAKDGTPAPAAAPAAAAKEGEQPAEPAKEGEPAKEPLAKFRILQGDAEVDVPADVKIAFTAAGKERTESLDKVVKLAQVGFYNEEREQQIKQGKAELQTYQTQLEAVAEQYRQIAGAARALDEYYGKLFEDEDLYYAAREEFLKANTPEARLERLAAENALFREGKHPSQLQQQEASQHTETHQRATQFVATLAARVGAIATQFPKVSQAEIHGQFGFLTAPLVAAAGGRISTPEQFAAVQQLVENELIPWAQHRHEQLLGLESTASAAATREKEARKQLTLTRRVVQRHIAPRGARPTGGARPVEPLKPTDSAQTANDKIIAEVFADLR